MSEDLKEKYLLETSSERRGRMLAAAFSALVLATFYVWTFYFINVYTFPNLPLGLDWARLVRMWVQFGVPFALFGAVVAWFSEEHTGIIGGALIFTVSLAIVFWFSSNSRSSTFTMQAILMAILLMGAGILASWGLRWAANRYLAIQDMQGPNRRQALLKHTLAVILIGLIPGILTRMDSPSVQALSQLHELLQAASREPSAWSRPPFERVPALQEHSGVDYLMYPRQSSRSVGVMEVTVRFSDGFRMTCLVSVGSGQSFITQCKEGEEPGTSP